MPRHGEYDEAWLIANQFCRVETGQYTGDGAIAQAIVGVGFDPLMVWICPRLAIETVPMLAWASVVKFWTGNAFSIAQIIRNYSADAIISLDADGFTVDDNGADDHPNKDTQVYDYIAFG